MIESIYYCLLNSNLKIRLERTRRYLDQLSAADFVSVRLDQRRSVNSSQRFQIGKICQKRFFWDSRTFSINFMHIYIISFPVIEWTSKICQTKADHRVHTRKFSRFFIRIFGGFFSFGPTV